MTDYVDRLTRCGMNLIDAYEVCDDYLYDSDFQGLDDYVRSVEAQRKNNVD